jgi:ABC-type branched-subunit amino acid transport system substrate-binding protein
MLVNTRLNRINLLIGLAIAIIISDSVIYFSEAGSKEFYSNWIIIINASIAAGLATLVLYKHKHHDGIFDKSHAALAIGLCLWLTADIIWAVYQIVLEIVPPVPSMADFVWFSAYGFFAFYLYSTYFEFHKKFRFSRRLVAFSIIGAGVFLSYIIAVTTSIADLSSNRGIAMFFVVIAYPVLDSIIIVPAVVILLSFRKEPVWFTPWLLESAGIFLMAISDSWFALVVVTSLLNEFWLSALFFASHYIIISAGLLWYIIYLIREKKSNSELSTKDYVIANGGETTPSDKLNFNKNQNTKKTSRSNNEKKRNISGLKSKFASVIIIIIISWAIYVFISLITYHDQSTTKLPGWISSFITFLPSVFSGNSETIIHPSLEHLASAESDVNTTMLGALLPISGASASLGESEQAALKIAINDINKYFSESHSKTRFGLVIEDTGSDPLIVLEKVKRLSDRGIKIIIGPSTSANVNQIRNYANSHDILLVSPSSTAPSLSLAGDNVFRFVPDDTHQAQAVSSLMWKDGIRIIVPFWRTDIYGNDLVSQVKNSFENLGGRFVDGVGYTPHTGDLSASLNRINFIIWDQELKTLEAKLKKVISNYGVHKVGIYFVAYDEVAPIFIQAQGHDILSDVKWFGSDGSALNNKVVRNTDAAIFASKTGFANPIFGVENASNARFKRVEALIEKEIERIPRSYASTAYDALWVAALAENQTNQTNNIEQLKNAFTRITNSYIGITGNTSLDQNGDRKYGDYEYWTVIEDKNNSGSYKWNTIGRFVSEKSSNDHN